jgi:polysaccharide export outer membrane protein
LFRLQSSILATLVSVSLSYGSTLSSKGVTDHATVNAVRQRAPEIYILGPDDQIVVQGPNAEDISNKPARIDAKGDVNVPLIGSLHAGGLTLHEFEELLNKRMSAFVRKPQLVVSVAEYKSQPVSVFGAVNSPGIYQIQGHKNLVEMISMAGGLRSDAGSGITVTREVTQGRLSLAGEHLDETGRYSMAEIQLRDITAGRRPDENIEAKAHDVISIARGTMVYVFGEVKKSGGFLTGDESTISVIQALSLAEGPERTADLKHARIIRNSSIPAARQEIACDLGKILSGKDEDLGLRPQDILYVPGSTGKKVALRALETAITTGSGIAIWGMR